MTDYVFLNKEFDKFADAMNRQLKLMLTSGNPIVKVAVEESLFSLYLKTSRQSTTQFSVNDVILTETMITITFVAWGTSP